MQWNAGTVRKLEEITETVAITQLERFDEQTASSFLLLTFLLRKKKSKVNLEIIRMSFFVSDNNDFRKNRFNLTYLNPN
jgi:hypothetical protein